MHPKTRLHHLLVFGVHKSMIQTKASFFYKKKKKTNHINFMQSLSYSLISVVGEPKIDTHHQPIEMIKTVAIYGAQ
jgi:hypothetical protein